MPHDSDDVLRSRYVNDFLRRTILRHVEAFDPLIERMMRSPVAELAQAGGGWVAAVWAHSGRWKDRLDRCLIGGAQLRQGVAHALALAVADECANPKATETLAHCLMTLRRVSEKPLRASS